jgi:intracellular septation protein
MALLVDFIPLLLFFAAFKFFGIFVATGVAMVASIAQIGWYKVSGRPIKAVNWFSLAVIVVFGGTTLILHDDTFIRLKMTAYYWLCALLLLAGRVIWRKNFVQLLLPKEDLPLPDSAWMQLLWAWVGFCLFMGALNLYVAFVMFPGEGGRDSWVNFKVFVSTGLLIMFVVAQGVLIAKHLPSEHRQSEQ